MKRTIFALLLAAVTAVAAVPDPAVGRLPDGGFYMKSEVDFCLKADVARALSAADASRQRVDASQFATLPPAVAEVVGSHLSAYNWLNGDPLPAALKHTGGDVPAIARSLKAILLPGQDAAVVVEQLRKHPDVEWASLNRLHPVDLIPNDAFWTNQWGPSRINATNGWDVAQASTAVRVAVIDTGVDLTHPDLNIVYNRGFGGNASGDARRDVRGGTSIDHGTHVAGIAAASRNNNTGVAGVAVAGIMAMGCATWDGTNQYLICCAADAINDAVANGATVINCSFGNSTLEASESSALDNAQNNRVVVVCAAGNNGTDVVNSPSAGWAAHAWPVLVSNTMNDTNDTLNPSSNFGNSISLAAPGTGIFSTYTTNYTAPVAGGAYGIMTGTSQASPHVAGAVAVVRGMNSGRINGLGTRDLLFRMAQDLGAAGKDPSYGFGMLQLPATFLSALKNANTFAGFNAGAVTGSYEQPYTTIPSAVAATPPGGTIVLNGGVGGSGIYSYPAQTLNAPITLTAFPDRPATIGN